MFGFLRDYKTVPPLVMKVIAAEFFIQLVNASFMNLQPLYMKSEGYHDAEIADIISWRFAGVLLLAIPLGYYGSCFTLPQLVFHYSLCSLSPVRILKCIML